MLKDFCDGSSVGRTSPCQGEGRRFESGPSLHSLCDGSSVVECLPSKEKVAGSNPVRRSKFIVILISYKNFCKISPEEEKL